MDSLARARCALITSAAALAGLLAPAAASAATYTFNGAHIAYTAAPGEHNSVYVFALAGSDIGRVSQVIDSGDNPITAPVDACGDGTRYGNPREVICGAYSQDANAQWTRAIDLGDGADHLDAGGWDGADTLALGAGDDSAYVSDGAGLTVNAGPGDDVVHVRAPGAAAGAAKSVIDCGAGADDTLYYETTTAPSSTGCEHRYAVGVDGPLEWTAPLVELAEGARRSEDWASFFVTGAAVTVNAGPGGLDDWTAPWQLRTDDSDWQSYTPAMTLSTGAEGTHQVLVRVKRTGGGWSMAALRDWTVDRTVTLPVVTSTSQEPEVGEDGVTRLYTHVGLELDPHVTLLEYQLDGGALTTRDENWVSSEMSLSFANLASGRHTLRLRQTDAAGNVSGWAEHTFGQDVTSPPPPQEPPAPPVAPGKPTGAQPGPAQPRVSGRPVKVAGRALSLPLTCAAVAGCPATTYTLTFKAGAKKATVKAKAKALAFGKAGAVKFKLTKAQGKALRKRTVTATVSAPGAKPVKLKLRG